MAGSMHSTWRRVRGNLSLVLMFHPRSQVPRRRSGIWPWIRRSTPQRWTCIWLTSISSPRSISCHALIGTEFFSETGRLKKAPVTLTDFDVFWTAARIQFELCSAKGPYLPTRICGIEIATEDLLPNAARNKGFLPVETQGLSCHGHLAGVSLRH